MTILEAIQSTALSHPEGHSCVVCRAAAGDKQAMASVIAAVALGGDVFRPVKGRA